MSDRGSAIIEAAHAFAALCTAQVALINAECAVAEARARRIDADPPPPTREQIAGALPTDAGRRR